MVLSWGKYEYQKILLGVCNSFNIFKENISELFDGFFMVRAYIDGVLVITKNNFEDHLKVLDKVLQIFVEAGLKVNAEKSFFGQTETEYFGFWLINNKIRLLLFKVEEIKSICVPTKVRYIWRFVNHCRNILRKRAHTLDS